MLLAGFFAGRTERLTQLNRPDVGEGEKNVSFTVKPDGMEEWLYEGTIAPRIYSARELDELMDGAKKYIDENLFYEGESANEVISGRWPSAGRGKHFRCLKKAASEKKNFMRFPVYVILLPDYLVRIISATTTSR